MSVHPPRIQMRNLGDVPGRLAPGLRGRWLELPEQLSIDELDRVAHMINAHTVATHHLGGRHSTVVEDHRRAFRENGPAVDANSVELLVGFFHLVRGWRGLYEGPYDGDADHREAQSLYEKVRRRLREHPHEVELLPAPPRHGYELAGGAATPADRCYWVIPGLFLAGAYPGDVDRTAHEARLESLWRAGVRTFVSLMEENETNNAGVPFAKYADSVSALAARTGERVAFERFAIRDGNVPSHKTAHAALDLIDYELVARRPVYVHCYGGIGRTGTIVACWLLRNGLASPEDVIGKLKNLRSKDVLRANERSPENDAQLRFVQSWVG